MEYLTLQALRRKHPTWRLLAAEHAPLIISFLHRTFIQPNVRTLARPELVSRLEDYLFYLGEQLGENLFPKAAVQYLEDWSSDEHGWLRKYYPADSDEPHFDITPATEKAIDWLASLEQQQFVGAESRLKTVFSLLREITEGTEVDPAARLAELERRKAQIDADIQQIREGRISLLDATQVKDRFLQMSDMARGLLSDFRVVEQNFRTLDRAVRERIATWEAGKGSLLEEIFGDRDTIMDSDQGKSFRAFWDFLLSPSRQAELSELLQAVFALDAIRDLAPDRRLLRIHYDWMAAGEVAQRTVARLSEQLRRYLDNQMWIENRRILQLIREMEQLAIPLRGRVPDGPFMELDEAAPAVDLSMDRPLFRPHLRTTLAEHIVVEGSQDLPADALFEQIYVDKLRLTAHIRRMLQTRNQLSLAELVEDAPLEHGLAELVGYLSLAAESDAAIIDEGHKQTLSWTDENGNRRQATLPLVIFSRQTRRLATVN